MILSNYINKHQLGLMFIAIVFTTWVLSTYASILQEYLSITYSWSFELGMVLGQILFQLPFIYHTSRRDKYTYVYNMLIVSFIGSLLLCPLILINHLFALPPLVAIIYFLLVVAYLFFEHRKRIKNLQLPIYLSYTWILYRFLILLYILK